jgi:hypothetical protein
MHQKIVASLKAHLKSMQKKGRKDLLEGGED